MKSMLILLAGYPGTGKSYLANMIIKHYPDFIICSPDDIKEEYWDRYGFDSLDEKEELIVKSWKEYYQRLDTYFTQGQSIISDYPFSAKQHDILEMLAKQHEIQVLTIRLTGDFDVLFERQKHRDLDDTRHLGHIVCKYHKGIEITHEQADNLLTYEEFIKRCTTRGYGEFSLGETIEIDVSDFTKVDYRDLIQHIGDLHKG